MKAKDNGHDLECTCSACIELARREEHASLVDFCIGLGAIAVGVSLVLAALWHLVFR